MIILKALLLSLLLLLPFQTFAKPKLEVAKPESAKAESTKAETTKAESVKDEPELLGNMLSAASQMRLCIPENKLPKVTIGGIKYTVLDEKFENVTQDDKGRLFENYVGGNVYAIDLLTNLPLWKVNVYRETKIPPMQYKVKTQTQTIEPQLESACLVKMDYLNKKVVVTNQRGEKFEINPQDKSVKLIGDKKPQIVYE